MSSNIEWTDRTWNPVVGCSPVSPGCLNCYAATMARRLEAMGKAEYQPRELDAHDFEYAGREGAAPHRGLKADPGHPTTIRIAEVRGGRAVFTGDVRTVAGRLLDPLSWKKPAMVFVNSMSDLFHESVPVEYIARVWAVMRLAYWHTHQVLTKRPERAAEILNSDDFPYMVLRAAFEIAREQGPRSRAAAVYERMHAEWHADGADRRKPAPNVWLGTSVENQACADERIPHLLRCPAAVRFLSCEPLLGEVGLRFFQRWRCTACDRVGSVDDEVGFGRCPCGNEIDEEDLRAIHWVIVGGESGGGARACDVGHVRSVVKQCAAAGVACFVKQLGARPRENFYSNLRDEWESLGVEWEPDPAQWSERDGQPMGHVQVPIALRDRKGGDPAEWPEDLRVRQMPGGAVGVVAAENNRA